MTTLIDTTPKMDVAMQDIAHVVEALRASHAIDSPLLQRRARGGALLHPREAVDLMDCVAQHEAEERADAGHRVQQIQGIGVMGRGGCDAGACDVTKQRIVVGDAREINFDALVHRRSGTALGDPVSVGCVGDRLADSREGILAVGIVDMGQECAAGRRLYGRRSCRFWPCRHGGPSWRGHARGHKGYRVQPRIGNSNAILS